MNRVINLYREVAPVGMPLDRVKTAVMMLSYNASSELVAKTAPATREQVRIIVQKMHDIAYLSPTERTS